jgi:hypothetical protein
MANESRVDSRRECLRGFVMPAARPGQAVRLIGGNVVDPVQLDTDVTGICRKRRNVVELVSGERHLQPRKREQREPGSFPQSLRTRRLIALVCH